MSEDGRSLNGDNIRKKVQLELAIRSVNIALPNDTSVYVLWIRGNFSLYFYIFNLNRQQTNWYKSKTSARRKSLIQWKILNENRLWTKSWHRPLLKQRIYFPSLQGQERSHAWRGTFWRRQIRRIIVRGQEIRITTFRLWGRWKRVDQYRFES